MAQKLRCNGQAGNQYVVKLNGVKTNVLPGETVEVNTVKDAEELELLKDNKGHKLFTRLKDERAEKAEVDVDLTAAKAEDKKGGNK
jgi:hypothetical protein